MDNHKLMTKRHSEEQEKQKEINMPKIAKMKILNFIHWYGQYMDIQMNK